MKTTRWMLCAATLAASGASLRPSVAQVAQREGAPKTSAFPLGKPSWDGLSVSLKVVPLRGEESQVARPIGVQLIWKNTSLRDRALPGTLMRDATLVLTNDSGERIPLTRYGRKNVSLSSVFATVSPTILKPGQEFRTLLLLNQLFDLSESGAYSLQASFRAPRYFGPMSLLPTGILPGVSGWGQGRTREQQYSMRIFPPAAPEAMPQGPHSPAPLQRRDDIIVVPAVEGDDVPTLAVDPLQFQIDESPTAWEYSRPMPAR